MGHMMYAATQLGISFSSTGHANDIFPNRTLLREKLERALVVNCISHWHRGLYQSVVSRPESDYPIVRCGVDTRVYDSTPAPRGDRLEVLSVGRLVEKKGFDVLIRAAGEIAKARGPAMRVTIAGGGPDKEPERPPGNIRRISVSRTQCLNHVSCSRGPADNGLFRRGT